MVSWSTQDSEIQYNIAVGAELIRRLLHLRLSFHADVMCHTDACIITIMTRIRSVERGFCP